MTLARLNDTILATLRQALGPDEGRATARLVMEDLAGADPVRILTRGEYEPEPETVDRVLGAVRRIAAGEPPQYVVGFARWMGLKLKVTPATLIPRPETAGLVDIITDDCASRDDLRVLDVGTGSGCIAIALSRALPYSHVRAIDISSDALAVARENARAMHASVEFDRADILSAPASEAASLDIVVSNPPYITEGEADEVDGRVADYEPRTALFVPDNAPLLFYDAIARYAMTALVPGGRLYFEINPHFADALRDRLAGLGYDGVDIMRDSFGRLRYARAIKPQP